MKRELEMVVTPVRESDDECMSVGCDGWPEVEVIARPMDGGLLIDRATLCRDCAEQDLGGALCNGECVREICDHTLSLSDTERRRISKLIEGF